jgi:hypothetical protein
VIAVMDETTPADRSGLYYVVSVAVVLDEVAAKDALAGVLPKGRVRPFHWISEGVMARGRMLDLIEACGVVSHVVVHYPTGRRRQEEARRDAIRELIPLAVGDGARELIIESRDSRDDARDRGTVIEVVRGLSAPLSYRWEPKAEPLLWIADAVCGAVKEHLLAEDRRSFARLSESKAIGPLLYRATPSGPRNA